MKIFMGSLQQETNTFSTVPCRPEDFDKVYGEAMFERTPAGDVFARAGAEVIPSFYAIAVPSGRMKKDGYIKMVDEMVEMLREAGEVDGVWLYMHGAMDVEEIGSGELYLLKKLRAVTGMKIPYAVALDFHADISPEIVNYANIIRGYRTAPHRDMKETQAKAAELLVGCIKKNLLPTPSMRILPYILTGDRVLTDDEPFASVNRYMDKEESEGNMITASVFIGQNWADTPNNHITIITICDSHDKSEKYADILAEKMGEVVDYQRGAAEQIMPDKALKLAVASEDKLVFVSDSGDNVTAGANGNRTDMLSLCVSMGVENTLVAGIYMQDKYKEALSAGIGGRVYLDVCDKEFTVMQLSEKLIGWDGEDCGGSCLLSDGKLDVIITENRCAVVAPGQIESAGTDYRNYKIIVVKLGYLWPELAKTGGASIIAASDGESCTDIHRLPYKNLMPETELI